jgi:polyphosphate kinase
VVVELQARFDEVANMRWASRLEEAGIHVTYGVVGLKTHCKVILVVRKDYSGLRRYAHLGTGNYHAGTARLYSDVGILTCDEQIGRDLTELFNFLTTGFTPKRNYQKILPAPRVLKAALIDKIQREINHQKSNTPSLIRFKANALEDKEICQELYRASLAGVKIELIIRDTCRIRPGIKGLSDNITVVSIVGRFLEHSRIFYFKNGGEEEFYIGSADLMTRNLEYRVEVLTPIEDEIHRDECRTILDTCLNDSCSAWELQSDGSYVQRKSTAAAAVPVQDKMIELAEERSEFALAHKKIKYTSTSIRTKRNR